MSADVKKPTSKLFQTVDEASYQKAFTRLQGLRKEHPNYRDDELLMLALSANISFGIWALSALARLVSACIENKLAISPTLSQHLRLVFNQGRVSNITDPEEVGKDPLTGLKIVEAPIFGRESILKALTDARLFIFGFASAPRAASGLGRKDDANRILRDMDEAIKTLTTKDVKTPDARGEDHSVLGSGRSTTVPVLDPTLKPGK